MGIFRYFRRLSAYNKTVRALSLLSNHELKDIGIGRGDIAGLARSVMNEVK